MQLYHSYRQTMSKMAHRPDPSAATGSRVIHTPPHQLYMQGPESAPHAAPAVASPGCSIHVVPTLGHVAPMAPTSSLSRICAMCLPSLRLCHMWRAHSRLARGVGNTCSRLAKEGGLCCLTTVGLCNKKLRTTINFTVFWTKL